jgi:hypothetical protein
MTRYQFAAALTAFISWLTRSDHGSAAGRSTTRQAIANGVESRLELASGPPIPQADPGPDRIHFHAPSTVQSSNE